MNFMVLSCVEIVWKMKKFYLYSFSKVRFIYNIVILIVILIGIEIIMYIVVVVIW